MKRSDAKFIKNWKETQKLGWIKFSLIHGSLFGIIAFIITNFISFAISSFSEDLINSGLIIEFLIWLFGGILVYGPVMWATNQYLFDKKTENLTSEEIDKLE